MKTHCPCCGRKYPKKRKYQEPSPPEPLVRTDREFTPEQLERDEEMKAVWDRWEILRSL